MTMLATTITFGFAGTRHAGSTNATQRAYALAEAGLNDAVAILNVNYPGTAYPGDPTLLPQQTKTYSDGGSSTWSGTLNGPLSSSPWRWEWRITSTGTVPNPNDGTSPVSRTARVTVPVVIPTTRSVLGMDILNWILLRHGHASQ